MALEAGSRVGPYEVVELIGSGGMGEVYRARDPRLGREVAVKVLPDGIADRERLRRFEQEARAAGALDHPGVLAVHDVGTHQGAPYLVSELLEGQTLGARLAGDALPVRKALDYALQIARGLAAAHERGIVHRDLKPDNVFLTEDGRVKILDFGLAKLMQPGSPIPGDERTARGATQSGAVLGTVGYLSPEQARGEAVDQRSDIFSFGAVLYEMLSGRRAFRRDSPADTIVAILTEDPPELSGAGAGISPPLARIAQRCLEKRAADRFHSAHDLALALEAVSPGVSRSAPVEEAGSDARSAARPVKRHEVAAAALALVLLVSAGVYWGLLRPQAPPAGDAIDSVAVLPFENVGGDPDNEYLSDGVAENLINALSRLPDLRVMARSTSFRFRGDDVDPRHVGRTLGVGAVLTGRVSVRGDSIVIGAELVDVAQGTQLWGERYDTHQEDILGVQEEIARDVSRGLRLKPAPGALQTGSYTVDPEAYRLHLLSRQELTKYTHEGKTKALEYARRATEIDPDYAPAHATLAHAYIGLGQIGLLPRSEAYSAARAAATRALEIDDALPEAHTALAAVALNADWDWARAERELERALELDPGSADAHREYGLFSVMMGSSQKGVAHLKRAVELDPLSASRHLDLSWGYYLGRQFDEALAAIRKAKELDPGVGHWLLAVTLRELGAYEEAIAAFQKAEEQADFAGIVGHLGNAYARAGRVSEAREVLRELKQRFEEEDVGAYEIAIIHAALGEREQAFEWLERAYEVRDDGLLVLKVDPPLDPLRSDRRFHELVRRMNFPS